MLNLTVQYIYKVHKNLLPKTLINFWIKSVIKYLKYDNYIFNINFRFVDNLEGRELNKNYRHKDYATNVLTFVYDNDINLMQIKNNAKNNNISNIINADIVLSSDVIQQEAFTENKHLIAHYAHLIIHGVLHAMGYEHETKEQNQIMQNLEIEILSSLGFNSPY